ncbi:hypothetical protein J9303_09460 [Bacillaceae bacterium Marseille-Q3522]|nr:hypothetical protein [Bacillaceae bacterium Marseille-Q3522]
MEKITNTSNNGAYGIIDLNNIEDTNTIVSEVLTFDELVEQLASDYGISKEQASSQVIANYANSRAISAKQASDYAINATFRTIGTTFTVTSSYKPSLRFYCETSEGGYFRGILKILNVGMDRSYNGMSKAFGGDVYVNLEDPNRIF